MEEGKQVFMNGDKFKSKKEAYAYWDKHEKQKVEEENAAILRPYHQSSYKRLNLRSGVPDRITHELVQIATKRIAFGEKFKEQHVNCIKKYIKLLQRKGIIKFPVKFVPTNKLLKIEKRVKKSKAIRKV